MPVATVAAASRTCTELIPPPPWIDPVTLAPAGPGGGGELVLTNLGRVGSPILRYRTGDIVRRAQEARCECGSQEMALEGGILGRSDDMVVVRGVNLYPSAVEQVVRSSGSVLLDVNSDRKMEGLIRQRMETRGDRVTDLHLWQVGPGHRAAVISLISDDPLPPSHYNRRLSGLRGLSHVTVEVETCPHEREETC